MVYTGKVLNGVVVFDNGAEIADGTLVRVELVGDSTKSAPEDGRAMLMKLAGSIDDLPSDLARNHDHYLHGHPKQ
jgi:hypothetical protein